MTSRIQEQRFSATATKPANGARPTGEIWLNLPDLRIGLIDPAQSAVDLLGVRQYAATSTYALGDYVVHAGDLLRAKTSLTPHAFAVGDWDSLPTQAFNDARYTTQAQNDLRYYTKTQSDANYYNKTFIDTTYYTRIQSDARYYTQAQTDARYLQLTGGALSGELTVGGNGVHYTAAGGSNHAMAFGWDGAEILGWVDGVYIGGLATQTYVNNVAAQYLRLSGGTLTGALQVNANTTVLGTLQNSNGRLITYAPNYGPSLTLWQGNVGAMGFWYDGNLNYGGMDGSGQSVAYYGRLRSDGSIEASNRLISANGCFANSSQDFGLFQSGQFRYLQYASSWGLLWDTTNGNLIYNTPSGFKFHIDGNGSVFSSGSLNASNGLEVYGNSGFHNNVTVAGTLDCQGDLIAGHFLYGAADGTLYTGSHVVPLVNGGFYCGVVAFGWAAVFAYGYFTPSSAEVKDEIRPIETDRCLAVVNSLNPVSFKYKNDNFPAEEVGRVHCGFTTQDVLAAVKPQGLSTDLVRRDSGGTQVGLAYNDLLALLWGAVKELSARLETK